jgi:hypothetical protein
MNGGMVFALLMVGMVMTFSIIRAKLGIRKDAHGNHYVEDRLETKALRDEISRLRERVQTLEAIATDNAASLDRQIERLRDR